MIFRARQRAYISHFGGAGLRRQKKMYEDYSAMNSIEKDRNQSKSLANSYKQAVSKQK